MTTAAPVPTTPTDSDAFPRRKVSVNGKLLTCRESGAGPALVLLHGIGSNSGSWEAQLADLATDFRLIAWDAPGYGGSDALALDKPTPADYADHLAAMLDALGIGTCAILAHSFGALVAAAFLRRFPGRVTALILSHPAVGFGVGPDSDLPTSAAARVRDLEELGPEGLAAKRGPRTCGPDASTAVIARTRQIMGEIRPEGYRAANWVLAQGDIRADLAAALAAHPVPVQVMAGSADPITPEARARDLAANLSGARYIDLGAVGHPSYAEAPERYDAAVRDFLITAGGATDGTTDKGASA